MKGNERHKKWIESALKHDALEPAPGSLHNNVMDRINKVVQQEEQLLAQVQQQKGALLESAPDEIKEQILTRLSTLESQKTGLRVHAFWVWICVLLLMGTGIISYIGNFGQDILLEAPLNGLFHQILQPLEQIYIYGVWMVLISLVWWILDGVISHGFLFHFGSTFQR